MSSAPQPQLYQQQASDQSRTPMTSNQHISSAGVVQQAPPLPPPRTYAQPTRQPSVRDGIADDIDLLHAPEVVGHEADALDASPPMQQQNGNGAPAYTGPQRKLFESLQQDGGRYHNRNVARTPYAPTPMQFGRAPPPPPQFQRPPEVVAVGEGAPRSQFTSALANAVCAEMQPLAKSIVDLLGATLTDIAKRVGVHEPVQFSDSLPLWQIPQLFQRLADDVARGHAARCFETLCRICGLAVDDAAARVSNAVAEQEEALRSQWQSRDPTSLLLELSKKTELERNILAAAQQAIDQHQLMVRFRKSALGRVRDALAFLFDEGGEQAASEFALPRERATGMFSDALTTPRTVDEIVTALRKRRRGIDATWAD